MHIWSWFGAANYDDDDDFEGCFGLQPIERS